MNAQTIAVFLIIKKNNGTLFIHLQFKVTLWKTLSTKQTKKSIPLLFLKKVTL